MVSQSDGRVAAWTATAIFAVLAGLMFYWGLGGTWGHEAWIEGAEPPLSAAVQIVVVIQGLVDLACAGVLLVRVGYWREHVPLALARFARIGAWVIAAMALVGVLVSWPVGLILALLALVVARSELPVSPRSGAAATSSGKPGAPTPAR